MYSKIIEEVIKCGDELIPQAGQIKDIGTKKAWVTEQDIDIEKRLSAIIHTFPNHRVFGEEISDVYEEAEDLWMIDPISHTFNYLHGLPHYAVVVSHLHKGEVIFCVVYDPSMKELFTAEKGKGAFLNGKRIQVTQDSADHFTLYDVYNLPLFSQEYTLKLLGKLLDKGIVKSIGSYALNYAYVACGRAHAAVIRCKDTFPEFAGKLLVEEVGGKFTNFLGNDLEVETKGVVASNGLVHEKMLEITKDFFVR